jgi:cytochrome c oxidase subunit III
MPIISDRVEIERKPKLGGGGPGKIPHRRGFGGGDDGDRKPPEDFRSRNQRMRRYRIAMGLCLFSVTVVFVVLTLLYVVRLGRGRYDQDAHHQIQDWIALKLPYLQLWLNSLVLVLSSVTLELARRGMEKKEEFTVMGIVPPRMKRDLPWLAITLLLGVCFLAGQLLVWKNLSHQGVFLVTNPSRFYFYLLTGTHAVHLAVGLLALLFAAAAGRLLALKFESQRIAVEVTSWYWHYLAFLWFGIFALVHFARG